MVDYDRIVEIGSKVQELERQLGEGHLFHLCHEDHGDMLVVREQPPKKFEKSNEPDAPRLCVSRSVPQCLAAMCTGRKLALFVYRADRPALAIACRGVTDGPLTSELWLPPGETLTKIATIDADRVTQFHRRKFEIMERLSVSSSTNVRVASIIAACEVLDDRFVPVGLESLLRAEVGLGD